ncbi:hypothetical protein D3C87_465900 [compost metagenome]
MFVFVNGVVLVSEFPPVGYTITRELKDLLDDLKHHRVKGRCAFDCYALNELIRLLDNGNALATKGITEEYEEEIDSLAMALTHINRTAVSR